MTQRIKSWHTQYVNQVCKVHTALFHVNLLVGKGVPSYNDLRSVDLDEIEKHVTHQFEVNVKNIRKEVSSFFCIGKWHLCRTRETSDTRALVEQRIFPPPLSPHPQVWRRRSDPPRGAPMLISLSLSVFWVVSPLPHPSPIPLLFSSLSLSPVRSALPYLPRPRPPICPAATNPPMIIEAFEGKQHGFGNDFEPELLHAPIALSLSLSLSLPLPADPNQKNWSRAVGDA